MNEFTKGLITGALAGAGITAGIFDILLVLNLGMTLL